MPEFLLPQEEPFLSLKEVISENQAALLDSSSVQDHNPWHSSKHIPEEPKFCSPEVQGSTPAFSIAPSSLDPELKHCIITAVKAAPHLHIHHQFFR